MGEASRRKKAQEENMRKMAYAALEDWSRPASDWEQNLVKEINKLPRVQVVREPDDRLLWMKMVPNKCHANAGWYAENDPTGNSRMVSGWWQQDDKYLHHSVVATGDHYVCITPMMVPAPQNFQFIPDNKIEWRNEGEARLAWRSGQQIGPGLRANIELAIKQNAYVKARLDSGMDVIEAGNTIDFVMD